MTSKQTSAVPYLLGYLALVSLAALSAIIAKTTDWPHWTLPIDLALAAGQAAVMLWVFMHFGDVSFPTRLGIGLGLSLLLTLVLLASADVATRRVQPARPAPGPSYGFYER